ncbi:lipoprotein-releasing system ATP-binding protein [Natronocella acetinitrilica]|uniref:Lipoprotein-releasing system ATP-binding protein LolD n=1 Tax=Natronocella acetinitrilica TaxID=414046 RepID=A0AAE3G5K7_9GAMM|nr:lipoprotein-releasing ABC transporter ATP-binding protein LolD [Natronocella acetinitrilica]MCP1676276.1 lipoprotein-releasing system ATP-binding protein [Natronocella acetinitrilica]
MNEVDTTLSCVAVGKTFKEGPAPVTVLEDVNLEVHRGEQLAIVGRSGSGKSTLLHILGGLERPSEGTVSLAGRSLYDMGNKERGLARNRYLGFIYQFHHLLPEFTAVENVAMPLLIRGESASLARREAAALLERVGLKARSDHKPSELSGGERQRTAIARALVTRPACVLADEPTGNLDSQTADSVFELLLELNQQVGTSLLVVTHDQALAARLQRHAIMDDGRLSETA